MSIEKFGLMPDGSTVDRISIAAGGLSANILTYGAVLQDLRLLGHKPALVLGFDRFEPYLTDSPYFGAIAGRCANRIRNGHLPLDGEVFELDKNFLGKHSLHGGASGTGKKNWAIEEAGNDFVRLSLRLFDGEMGYPGNMKIWLTYRLLPRGVLDLSFKAETDKPTLCNLAHHSYFNLDGRGSIADHFLEVDADTFTPVDDELIPTGEVRAVGNSFFDFRRPKQVGPVGDAGIFDHNFCLSGQRQPIRQVARLTSPHSGVAMDIRTTEPGLQVYDGAKIDVPIAGLDDFAMGSRAGIALEPQVWPDAVHHPEFPQAMLRPGETYQQHTQFALSKEQP